MRFYTVLASRPQYYDRNPSTRLLSFSSGIIAPHGQTTRATYTVPTARKAFVTSIFLSVERQAAAAPVADAAAQSAYTPNGGSLGTVFQIVLNNNTPGTAAQQPLGQSLTMYAGDVININDFDFSTGGTMAFVESLTATEFDV